MTNQDEKIKAELAEIINKEPLPEEGKKWEWAKKLSEELLPKVKQLAKDCVEIDEGRVSNILNAIFLHGKETPDIAYDDSLPEGQMTIAKGFEEIKTCLKLKGGEEIKKIFELEWDDSLGKDWMNIFNLELCLFSKEHTKRELLKARELKEQEKDGQEKDGKVF